MKRPLIAVAGFALFAASGLAGAASWSVIVQPGVYGRVAVGGYAEMPQVYSPQPVVVVDNGYGQVVEETVDPAYATDQTPVYLWVPEYQRLHWAQYCREYGAYGVPVYFVDDGWYRANVMRRNWSPEQRSWSQQQWQEQDRLARDRFERQRFEQQRYEQQQRWDQQRAWQGQSQPQVAAAAAAAAAATPGRGAEPHALGFRACVRAVAAAEQRRAAVAAGRPVAAAGWPVAATPCWPVASNGGAQVPQPANAGTAGQQPPAASQPRGPGRGRAGPERRRPLGRRGVRNRGERRGHADGEAAFERGRDGRRDR